LEWLIVWLEHDPLQVWVEGLFEIDGEPADWDILPIAIRGLLASTG
jgi:hypothetical protein